VHRHAGAWELAIEALQAMSQRLTPLEKLDHILEASRHVYSAPSLNGLPQPISADDFLPVLVYVLLRANPPELQSNVDYISSYRSCGRMTGELLSLALSRALSLARSLSRALSLARPRSLSLSPSLSLSCSLSRARSLSNGGVES
jgi:hypothetical protein